MDDLDKNIVAELSRLKYVSFDSLAEKTHASESTVRRRVGKLIGQDVIQVIAVPNPRGKRGWAKIGVKTATGAFYSVARDLVNNPAIYVVTASMANFQFVIGVQFDTVGELTDFVNSELSRIPGIIKLETMIFSRIRKYHGFYLPAEDDDYPDDSELSDFDSRRKYRMDDIDKAILKILMENGLTRVADIKAAIGQPERSIRWRIQRMEEQEVFKYAILSNPQHYLHDMGATIGINVHGRSADSVLEEIIQNHSVTIASTAHGKFDIVVLARFDTSDMLTYFIYHELPSIQGVSNVEAFPAYRPMKFYGTIWPMPWPTGVSRQIVGSSSGRPAKNEELPKQGGNSNQNLALHTGHVIC